MLFSIFIIAYRAVAATTAQILFKITEQTLKISIKYYDRNLLTSAYMHVFSAIMLVTVSTILLADLV